MLKSENESFQVTVVAQGKRKKIQSIPYRLARIEVFNLVELQHYIDSIYESSLSAHLQRTTVDRFCRHF